MSFARAWQGTHRTRPVAPDCLRQGRGSRRLQHGSCSPDSWSWMSASIEALSGRPRAGAQRVRDAARGPRSTLPQVQRVSERIEPLVEHFTVRRGPAGLKTLRRPGISLEPILTIHRSETEAFEALRQLLGSRRPGLLALPGRLPVHKCFHLSPPCSWASQATRGTIRDRSVSTLRLLKRKREANLVSTPRQIVFSSQSAFYWTHPWGSRSTRAS